MKNYPFRLVIARFDEIVPNEGLLDGHELKRFRQLMIPQKKKEFVAARTFLKKVLAAELNIAPEQLSLSYTENGKPYLPEIYGRKRPHFNLSHSGEMIVVAIADREVGVDIECDSSMELQAISPFLSTQEQNILRQYAGEEQKELLKTLFVAKEAFIKATDKQIPLDKINFFWEKGQWKLKDNSVGYSFYFQCTPAFAMCVCC